MGKLNTTYAIGVLAGIAIGCTSGATISYSMRNSRTAPAENHAGGARDCDLVPVWFKKTSTIGDMNFAGSFASEAEIDQLKNAPLSSLGPDVGAKTAREVIETLTGRKIMFVSDAAARFGSHYKSPQPIFDATMAKLCGAKLNAWIQDDKMALGDMVDQILWAMNNGGGNSNQGASYYWTNGIIITDKYVMFVLFPIRSGTKRSVTSGQVEGP